MQNDTRQNDGGNVRDRYASKADAAEIEQLFQNGQKSNCRATLDAYLSRLDFDAMGKATLRQYYVTDIYLCARDFAEKFGISREQFCESFGGVDAAAAQSETKRQALDFLCRIAEACVERRTTLYHGGKGAVIEKAKAYIQENYSSEDISLNSVAMAVNLSPSYLSAQFRKQTGGTFVDYLSAIRVAKAKELLCCTLMQMSEIAYEVGYKDYRYFGKVFKKYIGCTPRDYQRERQ